MINDFTKTADYIATWIKSYMLNAKASTLVLGLSGGIDSALCALLIQRVKLPLVCVNMPCHSSNSAYNRAKAFADELNIQLLKVDLSESHKSISYQLMDQAKYDWTSNGSTGGLSSCLRSPTLSLVAHATNGLIVGTGNRSEDHITRYFQKFGDGCVDFSPIADLFKSEVYALFKFLAEEKTGVMSPGAQAIYDAKPTADLWGADSGQEDEKELGMSYDEIEWADREDMKTGLIFGEMDPTRSIYWSNYDDRQKVVLHRLWVMEKISRHKSNPNMPVCMLHGNNDLVE